MTGQAGRKLHPAVQKHKLGRVVADAELRVQEHQAMTIGPPRAVKRYGLVNNGEKAAIEGNGLRSTSPKARGAWRVTSNALVCDPLAARPGREAAKSMEASMREHAVRGRFNAWLLDVLDGYGAERWTVETALDLDVPAPVITLSLLMRFRSRQDDSYGAKVLAALRNEFGGHAVKKS